MRIRWLIGAALALAAATLLAREGEPAPSTAPINGFPNWEERVLHQWINRARVDPAAELAGCGSNCSPAEMDPACYTPQPPLRWEYDLAVAARFHSDSMVRQGFFSHFTPCSLRTDLASVYPALCDGSADCSCSGSGSTSPSGRAARFGASYSGEIIAAGYSDPVSAFYGWLHEPVSSSAPCAYSSDGSGNTNGHRWLILKSSGALGSGYASGGSWGRYYTTDFGSGGAASKLASGVHYPRQAPTIEFRANWIDSAPPQWARVVIGTTTHSMSLERGTTTNGTWLAIVGGLGTGCHRYAFEFRDSAGDVVRHPASGTFGIGSGPTCPEWAESDVPPPPAVTATATSTTSVAVSWSSSAGATEYQVERSVAGLPFAPLVTIAGTSYLDFAVSPNTTYLYRVRVSGSSAASVADHATTVIFTDDPLTAGTEMRGLHLEQLRAAVNAMREAAGLEPARWTDPEPFGQLVRAAHVNELRLALQDARAALGSPTVFSGAPAVGTPIRTTDFQELRDAVR